MIKTKVKIICMLLLLISTYGFPGTHGPLVRYPDVSGTDIVFVSAGDIRIVPKTGGTARRLSSPPGEEQYPKFSPDGKHIAFSGNYDGNLDIYIMPVDGGVPRRLTHHPSPDRVIDWLPGGKDILYATRMTSGRVRFNRLYKTSVNGGLPVKLPVPYGETASVSGDGKTLAFTFIPDQYSGAWKRYKGGRAPDIWLFDLENSDSKKITDFDGVDSMPMWHKDTVYFVSERGKNQRANIWAYEVKTGKTRQVTFFEEFDVMYPSMGPTEIIFENGGRLFLLDLATDKTREVKIRTGDDEITVKRRMVKVSDLIRTVGISPAGQRAVFEARGEIFTVPAENGIVYNLTRTPGSAERYPAWSPDGKYIAYFSDKSGEYALYLREASGKGIEKKLADIEAGFGYAPHWSPDSKKIVFADNTMRIRLHDMETGKTITVDRGLWMLHGALERFKVNWSPDSRYFAFSRGLRNRHHAIFIYDVTRKKLVQATSGYYHNFEPVFGPEGRYMFLFSSRTLAPLYSDLQESWIYSNSTNIAVIPLNKKIPSPLLPRNNEEHKTCGPANDKRVKKIEINLEGFERRLVVLPVEAGNYAHLEAAPGKVVYLRRPRTGASGGKSEICYFDLDKREEKKAVSHVKNLRSFRLSGDKKKILVQSGKDFYITYITGFPGSGAPGKKLAVRDMVMDLDPKQEWMQLFKDTWRFERDFFYDSRLHGVDWEAVGTRYEGLIKKARTRGDVNVILRHLVGELGAGHVYARGGKTEKAPRTGVGMLGVDFSLENGAYRIKRILDPGPRFSEVRSPLTAPGVNVKAGDYLLAVNGVALDTSRDPWAAFQGLDDKTVQLTVSSTPDSKNSRDVLVKTLKSEYGLRELAWVEENRKKVFEMSKGRIGYIYVPNTSRSGQDALVRQFMAQYEMDGLVIDERFNSGGSLGARLVELLNRPPYINLKVRNGSPFRIPEIAHQGPKVLLINGWSVSGGDGFPYFFKRAGIGPVIGKRTTGAFVGPNQPMPLVDGGRVSAPPSRICDLNGEWVVENRGTEPDIELVNDPGLMAKGRDPQLEKAVEVVLEMLEKKHR